MRFLCLLLLASMAFGASASTKKHQLAVANDFTAPSAPANFTVVAVNSTTVTCSWTAATDNVGVADYLVIEPLFNVGDGYSGGATSWTSYGSFIAGETYTFAVFAIDEHGNCSADSNSATITMPQPIPPADQIAPTMPGNLVATSTGWGDGVNASWTASTDNVGVVGYEVTIPEYSTNTLWPTINLSIQLQVLQPGTSYTIHVRAYDAQGNYSPEAVAAFTTIIPAGPG